MTSLNYVLLCTIIQIHLRSTTDAAPLHNDTMAHPTCYPENFSVPWTRIHNTWYSLTPAVRGSWFEMEEMCRKLEPGRTAIGTIMTKDEQAHVPKVMKSLFLSSHAWIGGVRIAKKWFVWYRHITGSPATIEAIPTFYWGDDQPNGDGNQAVMSMSPKGKWFDLAVGSYIYPAICELRCWPILESSNEDGIIINL